MKEESKPHPLSLFLSIIIHVSESWFLWAFGIQILLFIYKGITLLYAGPFLGLDISFFVSWGIITFIRHKIGRRGLARNDGIVLFWFFGLTLFALVANSYLIWFQSYVLRLEELVLIFLFCVESLEALLSLVLGIIAIVSDRSSKA